MNPRKILDKLEHDLSHFLISEMCRSDPAKRSSPEMYKYKGLNITADPNSMAQEKTISVRIGVLEAEFKINDCEKNSGALAPEEERLIMIWMGQSDNNHQLRHIFLNQKQKKELAIIPFDLEEVFEKG